MSTIPNTPVIVVTEEKKRRRGLIWVAAGAAVAVVAAGGGTFALWSDSASFRGGTITAGDLDLSQVNDTVFYDISPDRDDIAEILVSGTMSDGTPGSVNLADTTKHLNASGDVTVENTVLQGHQIQDLTTWRAVPGDTVAAIAQAEVRLVGDNLVAELSVDNPGAFAGTAAGGDEVLQTVDGKDELVRNTAGLGDDLTYTYTLYGSGGAVLAGYDHVAIPTDGSFKGHLAYFDATEDGQADGLADAEPGVISMDVVGANGVATITVVIEATFKDVSDRTDVGAAAALQAMNLSLTQLRSGSAAVDGSTGIGMRQTP